MSKQFKRNRHTWLLLGPTTTNKHVCLVISWISTLSAKNTYLNRVQKMHNKEGSFLFFLWISVGLGTNFKTQDRQTNYSCLHWLKLSLSRPCPYTLEQDRSCKKERWGLFISPFSPSLCSISKLEWSTLRWAIIQDQNCSSVRLKSFYTTMAMLEN